MPCGNSTERVETLHALPRAEVFSRAELAGTTLTRYLGHGRVRRLARGVYTSNVADHIDEVVRRNLYQIVGLLFPRGVISDRSFAAGGPTEAGDLYVIADRRSAITVGQYTVAAERGAGPQEGDMPMPGGVFFASAARGLLENARLTRGRAGRPPRTLTRAELEQWLERQLDARGEGGLRLLREQARILAPALDAEKRFELVDALIGAVLGTRRVQARSPLLRARQEGLPYDEGRLDLFRALRDSLGSHVHIPVLARPGDGRQRVLPFFEAYFSNFIEGTEFDLDEAIEIVYGGRIPATRPQDAHDILGTFEIVSDPSEMRRVPRDADDLLELLRSRHSRMMANRPELQPGVFKAEPNRAGSTLFVAPDRVLGTLVKGFDVYRELPTEPFARAVFMTFLVAEVHPFSDGNGRIARIMMNAELVAGDEERIIIPQAHRNDYLGVLRGLTHHRDPKPLVRVLDAHQRLIHSIDFSSIETARSQLEARSAFLDPRDADFGISGGGLGSNLYR